VNKDRPVFGYTDNNLVESRGSQTVHRWCWDSPFGNRRRSHLAYQRGFWFGG